MGKFTLIILEHNTDSYLKRSISYYEKLNAPIIIADSSSTKKDWHFPSDNFSYFHFPQLSFPEKMEQVINLVNTPYVVMCANDDFILPDSINKCIDFLEVNQDYSVAQGKIIRFYNKKYLNNIRFELMYDGDFSNESDNFKDRLKKIFNPYKTTFYGIHRTALLKNTVKDISKKINNAFLTEYIVTISHVLNGKYKDLPFLYQIREHSENSGDKTTANLDTILTDEKFNKELLYFYDLTYKNSSVYSKINFEEYTDEIVPILKEYAEQIKLFNADSKSTIKKIGTLVDKIPFFGQLIIQSSRYFMSRINLKKSLTPKEMVEVKKIANFLNNYLD